MSSYKKFLSGLIFAVVSFSSWSCPQADAYDTPQFCSLFESIAKCHCQATGLPARLCSNVPQIYARMLATFGSIEKACRYQKDTSYQSCLEAWQCYQKGGQLPDGRICNGTGLPCV